jgi:hypothetical protein
MLIGSIAWRNGWPRMEALDYAASGAARAFNGFFLRYRTYN